MKVLFVYDSISAVGGGSQMAAINWLKNFNKKVINVKILTNSSSKPFLEKTLIKRTLFNKDLKLDFLYPGYSLSVRLDKKVEKEIVRFSPEIIHFNESTFIPFPLIDFAKKYHIKVIASLHTNYEKFKINTFPLSLFVKKNGLYNKFVINQQNRILGKSDFILLPSSASKKDFSLEIVDKPVFFLPYPINHYFFHPHWHKINNKKKLISISRLSGEKNIDILIEMMKFLKRDHTLTIIGDGVDRDLLETRVKKLKLDLVIKFTGWIKNNRLPAVIKKHHLFVSASSFETFGITYIEALACGLPLVVFDSRVSREVIPNNTAVFVNSLDSKIWADKISSIDKNNYKKLIKNIKKSYYKINQYDETNSTKKLVDVYEKILKLP
jgi:1,2-diacylglycerol 3-alpha-glucosyltransferase